LEQVKQWAKMAQASAWPSAGKSMRPARLAPPDPGNVIGDDVGMRAGLYDPIGDLGW
jgi:hypothetical protein